MDRGNYVAAAMFASLAAGPAFLASLALAVWANETPTTYEFGIQVGRVDSSIVSFIFVIPFGFVISVIPNLVGAWFMHGLGIGNFGARLPVAWALAGAGAAGMPFAFVPDWSSAGTPLGTAFALTGASCALVAHRFTTWRDPLVGTIAAR